MSSRYRGIMAVAVAGWYSCHPGSPFITDFFDTIAYLALMMVALVGGILAFIAARGIRAEQLKQ